MLYCQLDNFKGLLTLANKNGIFAWVRKHWEGLINHLREMSSRNNLSTKLCSKTLLCFFSEKTKCSQSELRILRTQDFNKIYIMFWANLCNFPTETKTTKKSFLSAILWFFLVSGRKSRFSSPARLWKQYSYPFLWSIGHFCQPNFTMKMIFILFCLWLRSFILNETPFIC